MLLLYTRGELKHGMYGGGEKLHDVFVSPKSVLHIAIRSDKKEAAPLRAWLLDDTICRRLNDKIIEVTIERNLAIVKSE